MKLFFILANLTILLKILVWFLAPVFKGSAGKPFFSLWFEEKYYFGSLYVEVNGTASSRLSPYDISK